MDITSSIVEVDNPAEVLREQDGVFEVTSPYGHVFQVICHPGQTMNVQDISESERAEALDGMLWRIRRLQQAIA